MADVAQEANLAKTLAAESIQAVFRRYMECKELMKMRKMRSTEKLVKNLAAETITKGLRSLSRSRSRIQSETSSFHNSEVHSLASRSVAEPLTTTIKQPVESKSTSTRILQVSNLRVENVFGVVWQGKNSLYCTVRLMDWMHKTLTVPDAADTASWVDTIDLPIPNNGHDHTKVLGSLVVSIYHENLVVTDKLIAAVEVPLISIFEGDVSSNQYTCETEVSVEQTAFDGTKFKRKARGVVKFAARIIECTFDETNNRTQRIDALRKRDTPELIRLDSISGSLITHSIDPENLRDDSMYDFSSTQLREAVNLLQEWEVPVSTTNAPVVASVTNKDKKNTTSRPVLQPTSQPVSRPSSTKNSSQRPPHSTTVVDTETPTEAPRLPVRAPSFIKTPAPEVSSSSQKQPPVVPAVRRTMRAESRSVADTELTEDTPALTPMDPLSRTAPVTRPVSANATASLNKTTTRLRNRRTSSDDSKLRRDSIESGISKRPKPATDLISLKSEASGTTRVLRSRYGEHVIDEAFRLSMKTKGAFLKLSRSELASLLAFLNFPIRKDLLDTSAPISNLKREDTTPSERVVKNNENIVKSEDVSIPIVHAMSLAATISFLVRDHKLLENSRTSVESESNDSVGVINEEKAERVLAQLVGLVEGSYPDAKVFILKACASERAPVKPITGVVSIPCRPSAWSASVVRDFLRNISVTPRDAQCDLTGQQFLALDGAGLRTHFGSNPSIDRTRLYVYLQTLQYLDSWWDRGIQPGDIFHKETVDSEDPSVQSSRKSNRTKRRGSKAGYDPVSAKWGDLSLVLEHIQDNDLTEEVRARSKVVDGGRAIQSHLLKIADFQVLLEALNPLNRAFGWGCALESLVRFASIVGGMRGHLWVQDDSLPRTQRSNNSSYADLNQLSGFDDTKPTAQDEIGRWVVLQKNSANSTTELTQLVRLCQELRVVMKYTSREDDFIAFIPLPCLRVTSVQEIRARAFQAALEGLLLEDISVGKKVVVAGIDALVRTCERFDWWDRPSVPVLESMSNQVGEVVSLVDAQSKRRVGVRLFGSGICDALPLEALRLCTEDEYTHAMDRIDQKKNAIEGTSDVEGVSSKPVRRKSRVGNGDSRKTRLRTLIKNLNVQDKPLVIDTNNRAVTPPVTTKVKVAAAQINFDEVSNRSELSNLSGDELIPPPRASPSKKKKTVPVSPQKKLIKKIAVRNDPPVTLKYSDTADTNITAPVGDRADAQSENESVREIKSNYSRTAATGAVVSARTRGESPTDASLWSEVEPPVIDYSWLKGVPRSPIDFTQDVPVAELQVPPVPLVQPAAERKPASGALLHVIQAGFDADRAEYTAGVPKIRLDISGDEKEATKNHQPKYLRGNRPQSAPSNPKSKKTTDNSGAAEARTSFGLSGMGYVGNGQLQQHSNQWVNEDIPAVPEAEIPRVIPNKTPLHHTDYRAGTNKLFEFHQRAGAETEHTDGNHFGNAGDLMAAQKEALSPPRRTTTVPARPHSANPTSRGVSNPLKAGTKQTLAEALGGEFVFPGEDATDAVQAAKSPVKRTREEELRHIAAAKSAKEMSLKEKVLMKELKRLQKN